MVQLSFDLSRSILHSIYQSLVTVFFLRCQKQVKMIKNTQQYSGYSDPISICYIHQTEPSYT